MSTLGIIPAAGEGSRWGGYLKEFLPVNETEKCIDFALRALYLGGADKFLVVTNLEKITAHAKYLKEYDNISFTIQRYEMDIWGAMLTSLGFAEDYNLFTFADTVYNIDAFDFNYKKKAHFYLGMHNTTTPERFGVLYQNKIVNKRTDLPKGIYPSWGTMIWTKDVADYWIEGYIEGFILTYTDAINAAIDEFGLSTFELGKYTDFASWDDYYKYIKEK